MACRRVFLHALEGAFMPRQSMDLRDEEEGPLRTVSTTMGGEARRGGCEGQERVIEEVFSVQCSVFSLETGAKSQVIPSGYRTFCGAVFIQRVARGTWLSNPGSWLFLPLGSWHPSRSSSTFSNPLHEFLACLASTSRPLDLVAGRVAGGRRPGGAHVAGPGPDTAPAFR